MKINKNYKYVLNYVDDNSKVTYEFSADLSIYEMMWNLKRFLLACGWKEINLENIFKDEEDV